MYACDERWWKHHIDRVKKEFPGALHTQHSEGKDVPHVQFAKANGIKVWLGKNGTGLDTTPGRIHWGYNSGFQAINVCYHLGASLILLLGYDMGVTNGKSHYFGDHPKGLQVASPYQQMIERFRTVKPSDYGIEIINCTPGGNLDAFPRLDLDAAIRRARDHCRDGAISEQGAAVAEALQPADLRCQ